MIDLSYIFLGIIILFFVLLGVKQIASKKIKERICVICASISLAWLTLLILYYKGIFENVLILAILIGTSITGLYYLVESKVNETLKVFRLPFILTLIFIGYTLLAGFNKIGIELWILAILWVLFSFFYSYSSDSSFVKKIIECCKNW